MGCERKSLVSEKVWALYDTLLHDDAVKKALQYLEDTEPETIALVLRKGTGRLPCRPVGESRDGKCLFG